MSDYEERSLYFSLTYVHFPLARPLFPPNPNGESPIPLPLLEL